MERAEQLAAERLRLVEANDDGAPGLHGGQTRPQIVEAERQALDHRADSRALERAEDAAQHGRLARAGLAREHGELGPAFSERAESAKDLGGERVVEDEVRVGDGG